jgi:hypothetical protein
VTSRVESEVQFPTPSTLSEEPTSAAEFKFELEKLQNFKSTLTIKIPGQRAELLAKILAILSVVLSPSLLFWATPITLNTAHMFIVLGLQLLTLLLLGVSMGRRGKEK